MTALEAFIHDYPSVLRLRFQWQDLSGVLRARILPLEQALAVARGTRSLSIAAVIYDITVDNAFHPDLDGRGRQQLVPDWSSLVTRPALDPQSASVMCTIIEHRPAFPEPIYDFCPRAALGNAVEAVKEKLNADILVGFEVEFEIMKPTEDGRYTPYSKSLGGFAVSSYRDPAYAHVEEVVDVLRSAGVDVDTIQAEGARGQYEISLLPLPPIQAVDQLILTHDTIKHVFMRHGLVATMAPRPVAGRRQSAGQHAHVSIHPPTAESAFLAGVLGRLHALLAVCLPYALSYERVRVFGAGSVVAWGTEHRGMPVRKIEPGRWELRFIDASANMYVALATILCAGLAGCENGEELVWRDVSFDKDKVPEDGTLLPRTIDEAMDNLAGISGDMESLMQSRVLTQYLRVKKFEVADLGEKDLEDVRALMTEIF